MACGGVLGEGGGRWGEERAQAMSRGQELSIGGSWVDRQAPPKLASWEHPNCSSPPPPPVHAHHVKHDFLGAVAVDRNALARGAAVALHTVVVTSLQQEAAGGNGFRCSL